MRVAFPDKWRHRQPSEVLRPETETSISPFGFRCLAQDGNRAGRSTLPGGFRWSTPCVGYGYIIAMRLVDDPLAASWLERLKGDADEFDWDDAKVRPIGCRPVRRDERKFYEEAISNRKEVH